MHFRLASVLAALAACHFVSAEDKKHGEGSEGTIMGPVAFMWPDDRKWDAADDNIAPCGSPAGVTNRTIFPLSQGSVALTAADDAWQVSFYISFSNDPKTQSDFQSQVVRTVTEVDPGHQCYKLDRLPPTITAGTNATLQLQYTSTYEGENNNQNQIFYACADITFVEARDFTIQVPCFNVTSDDFEPPAATITAGPSSTAITVSGPSGGLSAGAKAGIAVGAIVAGLAAIGAVAFFFIRRRRIRGNEIEMSPRTKLADEADSGWN